MSSQKPLLASIDRIGTYILNSRHAPAPSVRSAAEREPRRRTAAAGLKKIKNRRIAFQRQRATARRASRPQRGASPDGGGGSGRWRARARNAIACDSLSERAAAAAVADATDGGIRSRACVRHVERAAARAAGRAARAHSEQHRANKHQRTFKLMLARSRSGVWARVHATSAFCFFLCGRFGL